MARAARARAGLKPEQVAEATGTHRASVYGWEAGREPQMRHALALADLYGVSIDSLFIHEPEAREASTAGGKANGSRTAAVERSATPARQGA